MLKRISAIFLSVLLLFGCAGEQQQYQPTKGISYSGFSSEIGKFEGLKAAMLLPLSGKLAKQGEGLQNAALLAMSELNEQNIVVDFFDTQSTPEGARQALRGAVSQGAKIIIGPLTSDEVEAITPLAKSERIPVVSFSTSPRVLQHGIYTLGLLGDEQIENIISYAAGQGRKNFAILVPDNNYGIGLARSAYRSAKNNGVALVKVGFYPQDSIDFTELLSDMTDYQKRSGVANSLKKAAEKRLESGEEDAANEVRRLKNIDSVGNVDFDAIIIAESGAKLKSASSMLGYYDVFSPDVMILGTATWDNTNLTRETTLYGAYYPALSKQHASYLSDKYKKTYGVYPESLYSLAYDAITMLSALADSSSSEIALLRSEGFTGLNGSFKFYANGSNSHNLKIFEVTSKGPKEVSFEQNYVPEERFSFDTEMLPVVYGKDQDEVLRLLQSN